MTVQIHNGYKILVLVSTLVFVPLGMISVLAIVGSLLDSDMEGVMIFVPFIFLSILFLKLQIQYSNKIHLCKDGLFVKSFLKRKKFYRIRSISKIKIIIYEGHFERMRIFDHTEKKISQVTTMYKGYQELEKWFAINEILIERKHDYEMFPYRKDESTRK